MGSTPSSKLEGVYAYTDESSSFLPYTRLDRGLIPFARAAAPVYSGGMEKTIPCGWRADTLLFLGLTHSLDRGNGYAYIPVGSEARMHYFIGDAIGQITIAYEDGEQVEIPLVMGFTTW